MSDRPPRDEPRRLGWRPYLALVAVAVAVVQLAPLVVDRGRDHAYGDLDSIATLALVLAVPAAAALALVAAVVTRLGWWRRVTSDDRPLRPAAWTVGGVLAAGALVATDYGNLGEIGAGFVLAALATAVLTAAGTEVLFRGVGVVVLRDAGRTEAAVASSAAAVFAVAHLFDIVSEGPDALLQTVVVALLGHAFYVLRRVSGGIAVPIAGYALVDFSLRSSRLGDDGGSYLPATVVMVVFAVAAVALFAARSALEPAGARGSGAAGDETGRGHPARTALRWIGGAVGAVVAVVVVSAVVPVPSWALDANPEPTDGHAAAVARFEAVVAADEAAGAIEPCRSQLFDHGERVDVAVVLFHGLTNCPKQFVELGRELYDEGANVVILRAPYHGLAGDDGTIGGVGEVGPLSAQDLRDYADESVDIARGLGEQVRVLGLSMGGVVSMWAAQFRDDVQRVVAVAPAISIPRVPHFLTTGFANLGNRVPNVSLPSSGTKLDHAYAGESTGALAAMFLLARANENEITRRPAAASEVIVVLNPDDDQVDNAEVGQLVEQWEDDDGAVEAITLPEWGLPHDLIDGDQPEGDVDLVYPVLLDLLGVADG